MAIGTGRRQFISTLGGAARIAIALAFTAAFTMRSAAQDFMAPSGAPAEVFPKPKRPVADIVSPIWHGERSGTPPANHASSCGSSASSPG